MTDPKLPDTAPVEDVSDDAVIGRALIWSAGVFALLGLVAAGIVVWQYWPEPTPPGQQATVVLPSERTETPLEIPHVPFVDITDSAGIDFQHTSGASGDKLLPETMGGGCAFLDYDRDGDQDLFFVNSTYWPWDAKADDSSPTMRLYQNNGSGQFTDVTDAAGLRLTAYGMGVAAGDYDNDGWTDLFISAVGKNWLFRNNEGQFEDATETAGVAGLDSDWSTSSAFVDYDNDGNLDLFVANYVQWSREIDLQQDFRLTGIGRAYGPPTSFGGSQPYLYHNEGDGTFRDVSAESGVQQINGSTGVPVAKSLGVAPVDIDRDGWIDLIVANDTVRNLVFRNQQDGTFEEIGIQSGVAFDSAGKARGAMGIDVAEFRDDGSLGIAIANFANEMTGLYVSTGPSLSFSDDAISSGLGPPTRMELSFGLFFFDCDLDGRLDLLAANGHLENEIHLVQESQRYRQPARLFWNAGPEQETEFVAVDSDHAGTDLFQPIVGRGTSFADIDGDGDLDVVLTQVGGRPLLLRNDQRLGHHFVRLKLIGTVANRDAIGAWVEVHVGDAVLRRQVMPTRSYLSQVELPVTVGIGTAEQVDQVVIHWPGAAQPQIVDAVPVDQMLVVEQQP